MKVPLTGVPCVGILSLMLAVSMPACKSRDTPQPVEPPAPVPPAGYAEPDGAGHMAPGGEAPTGRFGYRGDDPAAPPPAAGDPSGMRDVRDLAPGSAPAPTAPAPGGAASTPPPPPASSPTPTDAPFANPVPGDPLMVTLPGRHASLGPISIERYDSAGRPTGEPLKRGTPVQIPDPNNPGQRIYFKVP